MTETDDIPRTALQWVDEGREVALATVVATWGSAPRRPGAMLVVDRNLNFEGSVSGGCVESAVITEAMDALDDGRSRMLKFGVADETAFEVGLACGGDITILVEPLGKGDGPPVALMRSLVSARAARRPVILRTNSANWQRELLEPETADTSLKEHFVTDKSAFADGIFTAVHNPPLRLAIVGAAHIAQPLVKMAKLAGYDVAISDPRESFATEDRFPDTAFLAGWSDEALLNWGLDARTAVVTLSHDPKIDTPALVTAVSSDAFYVGALGSRRTHAKRVEALRDMGLSEQLIARIDAPVGLDIGAVSPSEIAISIMAELTLRLRRPHTRR